MTRDPQLLTRRTALARAVMLVGGAISAPELRLFESALAATGAESRPRFLSADQLAIVERIADLIFPETDTPGAISVGTHYFIDLMLAEWASTDTQREFIGGLDDIDQRAQALGMPSFLESSAEQQTKVVESMDREAFAPDAQDLFFRRLKKLVLFAYFSSEAGATQTLRFDRVPGEYEPCLSLEDDPRAWFWLGHSYGL